MLTIMVLLRSNQKLPALPRRADRSSDHEAAVASIRIYPIMP
jgi:hypothetical protein